MHEHNLKNMNETDLPCVECGEKLIEKLIDIEEVSTTTDQTGLVKVAECCSCCTRYFPAETLSTLHE